MSILIGEDGQMTITCVMCPRYTSAGYTGRQ